MVVRGRVLLADDEPALLRTYSRILRHAGYEVGIADDGQAGADLFAQQEFDVVLADLSMPQLDGIGLLQAIRRRDPEIPFVLISAGPSLDSALTAIELGVARYLTKPVRQEELLAVVARGVQLRRMARLHAKAEEVLREQEQSAADRIGYATAFERMLGSLWVAFQPIVRWSSREIYGYEALMRSGEPTLPTPAHVLSAAEDLGRLEDLGRTIRHRAGAGITAASERAALFVNLHPRDLLDPEIVDQRGPLAAIAPRVVLEITERCSLEEVGDLSVRLAELRHLGFRVAVDDLGAGYAGLSSFTSLAPEIVKLDMGLIRGIGSSTTKQKLVGSMAELCSELGIAVVCEGIETFEERDALIDLGCDLFQGYLFAAPGRALPTVSWAP